MTKRSSWPTPSAVSSRICGPCGRFRRLSFRTRAERFERYYRALRAAGLAEADAHQLARLEFADHLIEVIQIAADLGVPIEQAAAVFFGLAAGIDFAVLDDAIRGVDTEDPWERRAAQELDQGAARGPHPPRPHDYRELPGR